MKSAMPRLVKATFFISSFLIMMVGWVMLYPAATAPGDLLDRITAQPAAWDVGHRWLLLGVFLQPFSAVLLFRHTQQVSLRVSQFALCMIVTGSLALAGQYAIDFAVLAQIDHSIALQDGVSIIDFMRENPWVSLFFYDLGDFLFLGHILFNIALFRAKGLMRLASMICFTGLLIVAFLGELHPINIRIGFATLTMGYLLVAWKMFSMKREQ